MRAEPSGGRGRRYTARMRTLALFALLVAASRLGAADLPPAPAGVVADSAGLFSRDDRAKLEAFGAQVLSERGVGLRVLTIPDAAGEDPKAIAVRALNQWRVGQKSVILLIVMNPRSLYLQPGTSLASTFDASTSSQICASVVAPPMRARTFGAAALAGLGAVRNRLALPPAARSADPPRRPAHPPAPRGFDQDARDALAYAVEAFHADIIGGFAVLAWSLFWIFSKVFAKKCPDCRVRMSRTSRAIEAATFQGPGFGEHTYTCGKCGHVEAEAYLIGKRLFGMDSSGDTYEAGTRDSWDSGSGSSSSDTRPSSDGSGGGGSSF